MINTRRLMLKAAFAAPIAVMGRSAFAQGYPARPVKIIVPAGAGTGIDAATRFFADPLASQLGRPFVPENRPGAGGLLGYSQAARSAPDGYTLILTGIPLYLLPLFSEAPKPPFDPLTDFVPVARVMRVPSAIVVAPESPYQTLDDLLKAMQNNPNEITYSSQGVGSTAHLCTVVLNDMSGTKAKHIPYKETSMALTDVVGGRIAFTCQSSAGMLPLVQGGRLRALAVTNSSRWKSLPDVPTVAESGVANFEVSSQLDFMAPAGTPETVLKLLSDNIRLVTQTSQFEQFCLKQAIEPEFKDYKTLVPEIQQEAARWKRIVDLARA
ncbi:tripartite tricarboxylate transporter substrate binding protein [Candidimonas sp. SYP-B2681]|uniref:Bug family tripartite tricarboxylate transporter substrate binding protein n=1 Tax=Candidimonas sp. SYP-B2681 TaxID=2497686 RepID=UPI000F8776A1|nr:tripartite tricarboxylate transporter substrate binding protein [Candidimonas sp. SYP-B2681]RTZ41705.1 tripartite tricarboxylate transporter substrate binding protein [Candidimonas sp. SYP-B2681]